MPQHVAELVALLELEQREETLFRGQHPETSMQRSFGGQVMAQALSAMYATMVPDRECHSLSGYFLRPGSTDAPIDYQVQPTRDGGSFSTRRVVAEQGGRRIFVMSASFKVAEQGLEHQIAPFERPAPPEDCPPLAAVLARDSERGRRHWEEEWGALDVRLADTGARHPNDGRRLIWVKTAAPLADDPRLHQEILAYASDLTILGTSTVRHPVDFYSREMQAATVNHSMWFHRPIRADGWVLYDQNSPSASNGLGFSIGYLYGDGVLGASCAQEGLIRVRPPE